MTKRTWNRSTKEHKHNKPSKTEHQKSSQEQLLDPQQNNYPKLRVALCSRITLGASCTGKCSTSHLVDAWGLWGAPAEQELLDSAAVRHRPREPHASPRRHRKRLAMSGATIFPGSGLAPLAPERPGMHLNGGRSWLAGGISQNGPGTTRK